MTTTGHYVAAVTWFACVSVYVSGPWVCAVRTVRAPGVGNCLSDQRYLKVIKAAVSGNSQRRAGSSDAALAKGDL